MSPPKAPSPNHYLGDEASTGEFGGIQAFSPEQASWDSGLEIVNPCLPGAIFGAEEQSRPEPLPEYLWTGKQPTPDKR